MNAIGEAPSVVLYNPKYPHNVGAVLRSCAAFGMKQLWFTGERAQSQWEAARRIPPHSGGRIVAFSSTTVAALPPGYGAFNIDGVVFGNMAKGSLGSWRISTV